MRPEYRRHHRCGPEEMKASSMQKEPTSATIPALFGHNSNVRRVRQLSRQSSTSAIGYMIGNRCAEYAETHLSPPELPSKRTDR
jgi:hypothetical protein